MSESLFDHVPPMPEGFADRAAWDAVHWRFGGNGSLLDQAVIGWQRDNQERVAAAARLASLHVSTLRSGP